MDYDFPSLKLRINIYQASEEIEYFLQYVDQNNRLFALLRLRLTPKIAIIREVHTYGLALPIKDKDNRKPQHKGLGKALISKAEKIAKKEKYQSIIVIAGVGTREYYRNLGYKLKDTYMVKKL